MLAIVFCRETVSKRETKRMRFRTREARDGPSRRMYVAPATKRSLSFRPGSSQRPLRERVVHRQGLVLRRGRGDGRGRGPLQGRERRAHLAGPEMRRQCGRRRGRRGLVVSRGEARRHGSGLKKKLLFPGGKHDHFKFGIASTPPARRRRASPGRLRRGTFGAIDPARRRTAEGPCQESPGACAGGRLPRTNSEWGGAYARDLGSTCMRWHLACSSSLAKFCVYLLHR